MDSTQQQDRRNFLKWLGAGIAGITTGGVLSPGKLKAKETAKGTEFLGMLVDTTRCIGCRECPPAGCPCSYSPGSIRVRRRKAFRGPVPSVARCPPR